MKIIASLSSAIVLLALVVGGCASPKGQTTTTDEGSGTRSASLQGTTTTLADGVGPNRLGYQPRVVIADLKAAGARCIGTHCVLNGQDWDCKGGSYCTSVAR